MTKWLLYHKRLHLMIAKMASLEKEVQFNS